MFGDIAAFDEYAGYFAVWRLNRLQNEIEIAFERQAVGIGLQEQGHLAADERLARQIDIVEQRQEVLIGAFRNAVLECFAEDVTIADEFPE